MYVKNGMRQLLINDVSLVIGLEVCGDAGYIERMFV